MGRGEWGGSKLRVMVETNVTVRLSGSLCVSRSAYTAKRSLGAAHLPSPLLV